MRLGEPRESIAGGSEVRGEQVDAIAHLQHERRVDRVLARRAPGHVWAGRNVDASDQLLNQRDRERPRVHCVALERWHVEELDAAHVGDRGRRIARDHPDARLRLRERRLEAEHVTDVRGGAEDPIAVADGGCVHRIGDVKSQNTVSPSPCSTMSNRYRRVRSASGAAFATSVARRASGTWRRMGSLVVDGSSSNRSG